MDTIVYALRFIRKILFVFFTLFTVSCANSNVKNNNIKADAVHDVYCNECQQNINNESNQRTINIYLTEITKKKNGVPLNNIELNAVLSKYRGSQVNGFCNHNVNIVDPVKNFLEQRKIAMKDSFERYSKIHAYWRD